VTKNFLYVAGFFQKNSPAMFYNQLSWLQPVFELAPEVSQDTASTTWQSGLASAKIGSAPGFSWL